MSIRAYRINKIESKQESSFNIWHDEKLVDELQSAGYINNFSEGGGQIELPVDYIEELISNKELELPDYVIKELKDDIKFAKKVGNEYVLYECY